MNCFNYNSLEGTKASVCCSLQQKQLCLSEIQLLSSLILDYFPVEILLLETTTGSDIERRRQGWSTMSLAQLQSKEHKDLRAKKAGEQNQTWNLAMSWSLRITHKQHELTKSSFSQVTDSQIVDDKCLRELVWKKTHIMGDQIVFCLIKQLSFFISGEKD